MKIDCRIIGNPDVKIKGISAHSRKTQAGDLFVAIDGYRTSGRLYVESAIKNGASAIATQDISVAKIITKKYSKLTAVYTQNPRHFLATVANSFYDYPSKKLSLIGITGTDGKTTTSFMIKSILEAAGKKTGLLGTIRYYNGTKWYSAPNTTPESLDFVSFLADLVKRKIKYCISEISSHALALDRTYGLNFKVGVFTNLTQDHLDFHKSIRAYGEAKLKLFKNLSSSSFAAVNHDDEFADKIVKNTKAKVITYGLYKKCTIFAKINKQNHYGTDTRVHFNKKSRPMDIVLPMIGTHNIYNMMAAIGVAKGLGISDKFIKLGLEKLAVVPGRLERIKTDKDFNVYIDYAHTAKALNVAIATLKHITKGNMIVVFGCGGNRDRHKRPVMGKVATESCNYAIITSDNPRFEKPEAIINEIKKGIKRKNFEVIVDRAHAIKRAISIVKPDDTILIAGKGHEEYQIFGDKLIRFSDKETVIKELEKN
jgi:UDP-N-acetylmuramoyl-L-alanyl-D-glutamate--2,6-diaminopimelate ligase